MADINGEQFNGFEHNHYQEGMHVLSNVSLWLIVVIGVAFGIFGAIWGLAH
jgi:hypothetical protein